MSSSVERHLDAPPKAASLTTAAREVLAIVAYRQPITRSEIERIRGAVRDSAIATPLASGLIQQNAYPRS